jgi:hypothetical protein
MGNERVIANNQAGNAVKLKQYFGLLGTLALCTSALSQPPVPKVKIGVLTDMSGM